MKHWSNEAQALADKYDAAYECPLTDVYDQNARIMVTTMYEWEALKIGFIIRPEFRGMRPNPDNPMEFPT